MPIPQDVECNLYPLANNSDVLAKNMAQFAKAIRCEIGIALNPAIDKIAPETEALPRLQQLKHDFQKTLLPQLDDPDFADLCAQTIVYGLFAARVSHSQTSTAQPFARCTACCYLPITHPILKRLFETVVAMDVTPRMTCTIDDLVQCLATLDLGVLLADFGHRNQRIDPVTHFYETFLAAYDRSLRKRRGVYYTPEPLVSFIVRSLDAILKDRFDLPLGLASTGQGPTMGWSHLQILDPATGTGTFLCRVVQQIDQNLRSAGLLPFQSPVTQDELCSCLLGFESLVTPYAIAHLKLALELQMLGYPISEQQSLALHLTQTLDEVLQTFDDLSGDWLSRLSLGSALGQDTARSKPAAPITIILGNPPYVGNSIDRGDQIERLMERYKTAVRSEKNIQPLNDDYIKFICFAHHKIEQIGSGAIGFVTNHSYLNGLIHRGMREELLKTFDEIYILDLHGNSLVKETAPDGTRDRNIFEIKQGVATLLAIKHKPSANSKAPARLFHHELWGSRNRKYEFLTRHDFRSVPWSELEVRSPMYFFTPQLNHLVEEYEQAWTLTDMFRFQSMGLTSGHDRFLYDFSINTLKAKVQVALQTSHLENPGKTITKLVQWQDRLKPDHYQHCLYRPFDRRAVLYHARILDRARPELWQQFQTKNLALISLRRTRAGIRSPFFVTESIADKSAISSLDNANIFPLYTYASGDTEQDNRLPEPIANFSSAFLQDIRQKLGYLPAPETIFAYLYAVFHSPSYRQRYGTFFKTGFPRLPLTGDRTLFSTLATQGQVLVDLHLLRSPRLKSIERIGAIAPYQGSGNHSVTQVTYKPAEQRVYINKTQSFKNITPAVWQYKVGDYQVLKKWLKDRQKNDRSLSVKEIQHYQKIVVVVRATLNVMDAIERAIPGWPLP